MPSGLGKNDGLGKAQRRKNRVCLQLFSGPSEKRELPSETPSKKVQKEEEDRNKVTVPGRRKTLTDP